MHTQTKFQRFLQHETITKNVADFQIFFRPFLKLKKYQKLLYTPFCNSEHPETFPEVMQGPIQNLGPISSTVLTFIVHK